MAGVKIAARIGNAYNKSIQRIIPIASSFDKGFTQE